MDTNLGIQQMENIVGLSRPGEAPVGFHIQNLEVARLSEEALSALHNPSDSDVKRQLKSWSQEISPSVKSDQLRKNLRSLSLNVTQICNLHCKYCAAGGDGSYGDPIKKISVEKTIPQLRFLLEKVPAGESFKITFLGGEPLLYPEAIDMIAESAQEIATQKQIRLSFTVVTNGTLLTDSNVDLLCKLKAHMTISLDGPAEVNDQLRPTKSGRGSTDLVLNGIQKLISRKSELGSVGISGVFGARNPDLISAYKFYSSLGVDWFDFTYDHLETRAEVSRDFTDQLFQVADLAWKKDKEKALRQIKVFDHYFQLLDSQQRNENYCGAGKSFLMMDARNNLYTCPWVVGRSKEVVGTQDTLSSEKLKAYEKPLVELNNCGSCWARYLCGGGCMYIHENKTGSKHRVDENFCERTRNLIGLALLYYEKSRSQLEERQTL
ncbi:MAG: thioether cross-link-forming SCIFF peptide maturase [Oligoflexia bacterium]|nr:MAG: thioether cross-link-forming SCIFF peptide maturase [Oligoflexia bacterium]